MKQELLHILQHSLGLDEYGQGRQYRNHFCAGGKDEGYCRELVALGFMEEAKHIHPALTGGTPTFHVTEAGKEAVEKHSPKPPKLTRAQQRYQRFREYGVGFDSFREFLRWDADPEHEWNQKRRVA